MIDCSGYVYYPLTTSSTQYLTAARGSGKTSAVQKAIYEALCEPYKPTITYTATTDWYKTTAATKEDLIRYLKTEENSVYGIAKEITDKYMEGEPKVYYFTKDVEIKKKTGKKGSCMQYNFILCGSRYAFLTVENYDEDCNLSADFILSISLVCHRCGIDKLIFRDHKVIAISKDQRYCGEDEKTKKSIWKKKSYVADCMDADDYNPYIGAAIAVSKCVRDIYMNKDSKSHLRRLREKIDQASEDA